MEFRLSVTTKTFDEAIVHIEAEHFVVDESGALTFKKKKGGKWYSLAAFAAGQWFHVEVVEEEKDEV